MGATARAEPNRGHSSDVARMFREHGAMVERALRRSGVAEADLADARQEVFIVVHRRLAEFEARSSVTTWLYGIAYRVACDFRRRAARRHARAGALGDDTVADGDGALAIEQRDALLCALRAIDRLAPERREVFVLHELCELPMREVAARVRCPLKTAFSRLYAARRALLAELRDAGVLGALPWTWLHPAPGGLSHLGLRMRAGLQAWKMAAALASLGALCLSVPARQDPTQPALPAPPAALEPVQAALTATSVAPRAALPARTARRAVTRVEIELARRATSPDATELAVIRASAVDLRPVGWNPFAAEFAAPAAPLRARVNGPVHAAASVDEAFALQRASAEDDLDFDL
jgi:RNA polymerase sigma-70 factor (ECF subfamily)